MLETSPTIVLLQQRLRILTLFLGKGMIRECVNRPIFNDNQQKSLLVSLKFISFASNALTDVFRLNALSVKYALTTE